MWCATSYVDLLIIGAGPAGLAAACWAARYNLSIQIIDQKSGRTKTGHADGLQSRTLEILESFGIVDPILKQGAPEVDMCYWAMNPKTGNVERRGIDEAEIGRMSRFGQTLLNQGYVEQNFIDHLCATSDIRVEWNRRAEFLQLMASDEDREAFPVAKLLSVKQIGTDSPNQASHISPDASQMIRARYLIACDGAHSWTRHKLNVSTDGSDKSTDWGVLDIVPITDFPDIRQACSVQSEPHGSIMTVPRENKLVRFYIQLQNGLKEDNSPYSSDPPRALVEMASRTMSPYKLTYKHCDWWSYYSSARRVAQNFRPHKRIFLAGDAAHTHSPKGGQGMNVSIQDTYNLVWKLGAVLTEGADPVILETYDSERRSVAKELMDLDACLVEAYEDRQNGESTGVYEVREKYAGFMAGVEVTYSPSVLVADGPAYGNPALAQNIKLGMRLPSYPVTYQCDGVSTHLAQRLTSDGSWKLLVFAADLGQPNKMETLANFADFFTNKSHLAHLRKKEDLKSCKPMIDVLLIHSSSRNTVKLLDSPSIFHPFDEVMGWDYWKLFADDSGQAYSGYGIDGQGDGCLILCRPDQHVAWIGGMEDMTGLDNYFSFFS
ncbi:Monooxygenase FAD-binding [Penicillium riverlandense]|uniref:Monooxygenase FAD-binding n=1 Tax=Penicillium riverlandense TaxID=1903569 RepID=UPI0025477353|nr:Monooxygenase FAD-binding [Penicillium riverlandense]KAJ5814779.1 Monooxygenase FAD-binding [Penicillium riverlandense]